MKYCIVDNISTRRICMTKTALFVFMIFILVIPTLYAGDEDPVIAEAGDYVIKQSDLDRQLLSRGQCKSKLFPVLPGERDWKSRMM
jgi:hypothetical protein